jgi:putative endonuclease
MAFYVYVLVNENGDTCVGQTADLERRLQLHNDPECDLTLHTQRLPGPWDILYSEKCADRAEAMKREKQLKSGGGRRFISSLKQNNGT